MKLHFKLGLAVAALVLMALPLQAYTGFVVGEAVAGQDIGACDTANLVFTTPDNGGSLFVFRENDPADIMYSINGNSATFGGNYSAGGDYDFPSANFPSGAPVTSNDETIWVIVTAYPGGAPGDTHEGWAMIDNTCGLVEDMAAPSCTGSGLEANVVQRLRIPAAVAGVVNGGDPNTDATTGFDVSFEYPTEFGGTTGNLPCQIGGVFPTQAFDSRIFIGFNVYRINLTANGLPTDGTVTDPLHYLCGVDQDCADGNGAEGWVGFIPLDPSVAGLTVDDPTATTTDNVTWPAGVEQRAGSNPSIIFSDVPGAVTTDTYSYVYQPVVRGNPTGDWNGIPALDLDGDTIPEFIDPSGNGLGLTANGAAPTGPMPLVSGDAIVDGAAPTVAEGAVTFSAIPHPKRDGVDLSFLSSIEGDVVGFNLYRSANGQSYVQVNNSVIAANGTPLTEYSFTDNVDMRRVKANSLHYKVGVVMADGTTVNYGPYTVDLPRVDTDRTRTRRR